MDMFIFVRGARATYTVFAFNGHLRFVGFFLNSIIRNKTNAANVALNL